MSAKRLLPIVEGQLSFWSTGDQLKQDMDVDHAGTGGGVGTLVSARTLAAREPGNGLRPWLDRRHLIIVYTLFLAYAAIDVIGSAGEDQVWAIWAVCGYAVALLVLWRWGYRTVAVLVSVALAVLAPLLWLSVAYPLEDGMMVIERSASLLLHHGSPYLSADQVTYWLSYNPYLPVMTLFGLPGRGRCRRPGRERRGVARPGNGGRARGRLPGRDAGLPAVTPCSPRGSRSPLR